MELGGDLPHGESLIVVKLQHLLLPLWQEARDLARLTAHYYDYDKEAHR